MIVCHCRVVTDRAVGEAVRAGNGSLAAGPPPAITSTPTPLLSEVDVAAS